MKDSLFEMLISLFEQTLTEIKEKSTLLEQESLNELDDDDSVAELIAEEMVSEFVQAPKASSMRVFALHEQMKLTKASYQCLMRLLIWDILQIDTLEQVVEQLMLSDSQMITLEETKWAVHQVLSETLDTNQLTFLDLVLYQKEDNYTRH